MPPLQDSQSDAKNYETKPTGSLSIFTHPRAGTIRGSCQFLRNEAMRSAPVQSSRFQKFEVLEITKPSQRPGNRPTIDRNISRDGACDRLTIRSQSTHPPIFTPGGLKSALQWKSTKRSHALGAPVRGFYFQAQDVRNLRNEPKPGGRNPGIKLLKYLKIRYLQKFTKRSHVDRTRIRPNAAFDTFPRFCHEYPAA